MSPQQSVPPSVPDGEQDERSRLQRIVESWPAPMLLIDGGRFVAVNGAALAVLELDAPEQLIGRRPFDISPPRQPDGSDSRSKSSELLATIHECKNARFEWRHLTRSGRGVDLEVMLASVEHQGRNLLLCSWHDITERRRSESALRRSNEELEQFAYVVSHDLRQPLRMVNSYMQLLERRLADRLDDDTRKMMDFAVDGARRMDQMLTSLLEYSRVGRKGEPMTQLDSRAALDEALRFLGPAIQACGAQITITGEWPKVVASRDEFTRLLQNLVDNAIKYRQPDTAPQIEISVTTNPDGWLFVVADDGIGIEPDQFDRLFRVFQRLHSREQYEGSGIGLAVARRIVERHGGHIWVESAGAGQGSRFLFTLAAQSELQDGGEGMR